MEVGVNICFFYVNKPFCFCFPKQSWGIFHYHMLLQIVVNQPNIVSRFWKSNINLTNNRNDYNIDKNKVIVS